MTYLWQCEECLTENELEHEVTDFISTKATCKCGHQQVVEGFTD